MKIVVEGKSGGDALRSDLLELLVDYHIVPKGYDISKDKDVLNAIDSLSAAIRKSKKNMSAPLEKLDKVYEEYKGTPNSTLLPDGSGGREAWISNDPDNYLGYVLGIGGDLDDYYGDSDKVWVYVYDNDERFKNQDGYSKEFNFYKDLDKVVEIANKLAKEITPEMTPDEVEKVASKYLS